MGDFSRQYRCLGQLKTDVEVETSLRELFSKHGDVSAVKRFYGLPAKNRRYFLVTFAQAADSMHVVNLYKLRSFGFSNVLVELDAAGQMGSLTA